MRDKDNFFGLCLILTSLVGTAESVNYCFRPNEVAHADCFIYRPTQIVVRFDFRSRARVTYSPGQSLRYVCHAGYEIVGIEEVFCLQDGTWSEPPVCRVAIMTSTRTTKRRVRTTTISSSAFSCLKPPILPNGQCRSMRNCVEQPGPFQVNGEVECTCNAGYRLPAAMPVFFARCRANGSWMAPPPCEKVPVEAAAAIRSSTTTRRGSMFCFLPPIVPNAECVDYATKRVIDLTNATERAKLFFRPGDAVVFHCNSGYDMEDDRLAALTCMADGTWSQAPSCVLREVTKPQTRTTSKARTSTPTRVTSSLTSTTTRSTTSTSSATSRSTSRSTLASTTITTRTTSIRQTTRPSTTQRVQTSKPSSSGSNYCPDLPQIEHAGCEKCGNRTSANKVTINAGDTVTISCDDGFVLIGNATIICQENGKWSQPPVCRPLPTTIREPGCSNVPRVHNGNCQLDGKDDGDEGWSDSFPRGTTVTCTCGEGFDLVGDRTVVCAGQSSPRWSEVPRCVVEAISTTRRPVVCSLPEQSLGVQCESAQRDGASLFYPGEKAKCSCSDFTNMLESICAETGHWDQLPWCDVQCSGIPVFNHGFCEAADPEYDADAMFPIGARLNCFCNEGFRMTGNSSLTCSQTGRWASLPVCA